MKMKYDEPAKTTDLSCKAPSVDDGALDDVKTKAWIEPLDETGSQER